MKRGPIRQILFTLGAALACAAGGGCAAAVVRFPQPAPPIRTAAVVDFQNRSGPTVADWTHGSITPQEAGRAAADMVRDALIEQGHYQVMDREEMLRLLARKGVSTVGAGLDMRAAEIGRALGVDAVVAGRIDAYGVAYRYLGSRAVVRLSFWCVRAADGRRAWEAEIDDSEWLGHERDLAERRIRECVRKIAERSR